MGSTQLTKLNGEAKTLLSFLKEIIVGFVSFVGVIYGFYQLWQGDKETISWMVSIVAGFLVIVLFGWIGFSWESKVSSIEIPNKPKKIYRVNRYPSFYRTARIILGIVLLFYVAGGISLYFRWKDLESKVIILIANIDGNDPQAYRVTEQILFELKKLEDYGDTIIRPLKKTIKEEDGSNLAVYYGKRYQADLVVWGWYGVNEKNGIVTLHLENLNTYVPIEQKSETQPIAALDDFTSYSIQQRIGNELKTLITFISGIVRYFAQDYPGALNRFDDAIKSKDWNNELATRDVLFFQRGNVYFILKNYPAAISDYDEAVKINPSRGDIYNNRGTTYIFIEKNELARDDFLAAISYSYKPATVYSNLSTAYSELGSYQQARENINIALGIEEKAEFYYNRGTINFYLDNPERAIDDFTQALKVDPNFLPAYYGRAQMYIGFTRIADALKDYDEIVRRVPQDASIYVARGIVYTYIPDYQSAIRDFKRAIEIDSNNSAAHHNLGLAYKITGKFSLAISEFTAAIGIKPDDATLYYSRGDCYSDYNYHIEAINDFLAAVKIDPSYKDAYTKLGIEHLSTKDYDAAVADFTSAINIDPLDPNVLTARGLAYLELGEFQKALDDHAAAIKLDGAFAPAYYNRGQTYRRMGDIEKALTDYRKSLEFKDYPSVIADAQKMINELTSP